MTDPFFRTIKFASFSLLGLLTILLMIATIIERFCGTQSALTYIYTSPITVVLWALLVVASAGCIIWKAKGMSWSAIGLHFAFILIIAGAATTYIFGTKGYIILEKGAPMTTEVVEDDGDGWQLPFAVGLIDNKTENYTASMMARDYISEIKIRYAGKSYRGKVSMNNVLDFKGYRFFQSGIGMNHSRLSISYDPWGTGISYAGYFLLFITMASFLFTRRSRFRSLLRTIGTAAVILAVCPAISAANTYGDTPEVLQRPLAHNFGDMLIHWNSRVTPVNTMAVEFTRKVYGSSSFKGLTPDQVLTGWLFYYDSWKREPFIKVKNREIRKILGISGKYAALMDFYDRNGYKLDHALETGVPEKDLAAMNEKIDLIAGVCTGTAWRIFPERKDSDVVWKSWVKGENEYITGEITMRDTIMERIAFHIQKGKFNAANGEIGKIEAFQDSVLTRGEAPGTFKRRSERIYNSFPSLLWVAVVSLMCGLIVLLMKEGNPKLSEKCRIPVAGDIVLVTIWVYLTVVLGLRWIIGGHFPMSSGFETMLGLAWLVLIPAIFISGRWRILRSLSLIVAGMALIVSSLGQNDPAVTPLMPVLNSPLLSIHVMTIMTSYALFAVMMLLGILSFVVKGKRSDEVVAMASVICYPAEFLLAAGIFIGAIWANNSWGRYWGWDPKETWALITMFVYCLPLHGGIFRSMRSAKVLRVYYIVAFLTVLFTYFGVNYLLKGLHSYA